MGNTQSTATTSPRRAHPVTKKRSAGLRSLSCTSVAALTDAPSSDSVFTFVEKRSVDSDTLPILTVPPRPALTCVDIGDGAHPDFLKRYPEYQLTWILDALRRSDFTRLDRHGETYADYMGGSLYPESLISLHSTFLHQQILGNTHSISNRSPFYQLQLNSQLLTIARSSAMSSSQAAAARAAVLSFFRAPPEYTVIFTANASSAMKLVGEAYPFAEGSSYVLAEDSHNSVHGIREFATRAGADVRYIPSTPCGGVEEGSAQVGAFHLAHTLEELTMNNRYISLMANRVQPRRHVFSL